MQCFAKTNKGNITALEVEASDTSDTVKAYKNFGRHFFVKKVTGKTITWRSRSMTLLTL